MFQPQDKKEMNTSIQIRILTGENAGPIALHRSLSTYQHNHHHKCVQRKRGCCCRKTNARLKPSRQTQTQLRKEEGVLGVGTVRSQ